jgi:hypothetical protein
MRRPVRGLHTDGLHKYAFLALITNKKHPPTFFKDVLSHNGQPAGTLWETLRVLLKAQRNFTTASSLISLQSSLCRSQSRFLCTWQQYLPYRVRNAAVREEPTELQVSSGLAATGGGASGYIP